MALTESEAKILTALTTEHSTVQRLVTATGLNETTIRNALYSLTYVGFVVGRGRQPVTYEMTDQGRMASSAPVPQYVANPPTATP